MPPFTYTGRGAHTRDEHVLINRQIVPAAGPLLQVAGELIAEVLSHVVERFAPIAADQCGPHFAGDDREHRRHTRVLRPAQRTVFPNRDVPVMAICLAFTALSVSR